MRRRSKRERRQWLADLRAWLTSAIPSSRLTEHGSRWLDRSPQQILLDVRHIFREWADEACRMDQLAWLWLAKAQREHLLDLAMRKLDQCTDDKEAVRWQAICHTHMRERDALMVKIERHRTKTGRDRSPDGQAAREGREGMITLSEEEWQARLEQGRALVLEEVRQAWAHKRLAEEPGMADGDGWIYQILKT